LNIIVCVKQVPDTTAEKRLGDNKRLDRAAVESILNPFDEYAVEEAIRIKEAQGATVTVLCMGPQGADSALRKALAMGCDNGVLVSAPALAGTDTLGTARVLAAAIKKLPYDLVLTGMQSTDARTGQVPAAVAELLGLPMLTQATRLEVEPGAGKARIRRPVKGGHLVLETDLPALVSVSKAINEPRYPALRGIMLAKKKDIITWSAADLALDPTIIAGDRAHTRVISTSLPPARAKGTILRDDAPTAARKVADYLERIKII
jgi:electron transfer flavoprotein beta subunit